MKSATIDYFASVLAANESGAVWGLTKARRVRFGSFEADLENGTLTRNGAPVALAGRWRRGRSLW